MDGYGGPQQPSQRRSRSPSMGVTSLQASLAAQQQQPRRSPERSPGGILRVDVGKPRRSSGSSVEFRDLQAEPPSPQPSVDRLSVSFAAAEDQLSGGGSDRSDSSVRGVRGLSPATCLLTTASAMQQQHDDRRRESGVLEEDEDDDYSASVQAILQRRGSSRRHSKRRKRRPSSPCIIPDVESNSGPVRRRSSVFTTSSAEYGGVEFKTRQLTGGSLEDAGVTQEQIFERLKLHKEVLQSARQQPWPMRRKLRLVRQAKGYVRRHEGELQERLAHSRTTRDIAARVNILLLKFWRQMRREGANLVNYLVPWESRIKEIESHFGSAVASYFTFLRWLFWVNLVITALLVVFVAVPELLGPDARDLNDDRKKMLPDEEHNATNLATLWDFEGVLRYSPMFYGFYSNRPRQPSGYRLPFAYFMTSLAVYVYSFVATLRKMAKNSRMSKLSEKADECVFTWKLFTGWDYMIGNEETAHNRTASIVLGFKEALLDEREKVKDARNWKLLSLRLLVNVFVLLLFGGSAWAVVIMVRRSEEAHHIDSWWRQNEVSVVLSLITYLFPTLFELLGMLEQYHPRKQLRLQLARIMVLNLMNLYSLILALFGKINKMTMELESYRPNTTLAPITSPLSALTSPLPLINLGDAAGATAVFLATTTATVGVACQMVRVVIPCSTTAPTSPSTTINYDTTLPPFSSSSKTPPTTTTSSSVDPTFPPLDFTKPPNQWNFSTTPWDVNIDNITTNSKEIFNFTTTEEETTTREYDVSYNDYQDDSPGKVDSPPLPGDLFGSPIGIFTRMVTNMINTWPALVPSVDNETSSTSADVVPASSTETTTMNTEFSDLNTTEFTTVDNETREGEVFTITSWQDSSVSTEEGEQVCWGYEERCPTELTSTTEALTSQQQHSTPAPDTSTETTEGPCEEWMTTTDVKATRRAGQLSQEDLEAKRNLRRLCWETMFGQELVKLTVMDLVMTVATVLILDFFRALFVRVMNNCWCWDLEKQFPQYGDFKIAENILQLVHNQGMVWMGMFFSPGLPALNLVKLVIILYLRSWAVLTCNVPHEVLFRASRSNNFYLALLLTMLFLCVLPVSYAVVWLEPSWHCGPFSYQQRVFHILTKSIRAATPHDMHHVLDYVASPGVVIPLLVLLSLIIYYLLSLTGALREANADLKVQLRQERTEERRKMFQLVERHQPASGERGGAAPLLSRWRNTIPRAVPPNSMAAAAFAAVANKKASVTIGEDSVGETIINNKQDPPAKPALNNGAVALAAVLKKHKKELAARRARRSADEEETTDVEQSLPEDPDAGSTGTRHQGDIPLITISKTESQDRLLDGEQNNTKPSTTSVDDATTEQPEVRPPSLASIDFPDFADIDKDQAKETRRQCAEPQQPMSPSRIEHMLAERSPEDQDQDQ